jgi:PAS domain S-box-containing protein
MTTATTSTLSPRSHRASLDGVDVSCVLANSLTGILLVDVDGRIRYANAAVCELTGLQGAALRGRPLDELIDVDLHAALDAGATGFAHGLALLDGGACPPIYVQVRVHPLDGHDSACAVVELAEPPVRPGGTPADVETPTAFVTATGRVVHANHAMEEFVGRSDVELQGALLDELVGFADDSTRTLIATAAAARLGVAGSPGMVFTTDGPVPIVAVVQSTGDRLRPFAVQLHAAQLAPHAGPAGSPIPTPPSDTDAGRATGRPLRAFWRR